MKQEGNWTCGKKRLWKWVFSFDINNLIPYGLYQSGDKPKLAIQKQILQNCESAGITCVAGCQIILCRSAVIFEFGALNEQFPVNGMAHHTRRHKRHNLRQRNS